MSKTFPNRPRITGSLLQRKLDGTFTLRQGQPCWGESFPKATAGRPHPTATEVEPRTKVTCESDWAPFATIAKSAWSSLRSFLTPYQAKMPTPVNTLWCPIQSPNINLPAGIFFVLKLHTLTLNPGNLLTFPNLSGGWPAELTVPNLSLLLVLDKNLTPFWNALCLEILFQLDLRRPQQVFHHQGHFPGSHSPLACPLQAQSRKGLLGLVLPSHVLCLVTWSSHHAWAGFLLCPREASVMSGGRNKRYPCGHTPAQQPVPTYWLFTRDGPGSVSGDIPQHVLVLI